MVELKLDMKTLRAVVLLAKSPAIYGSVATLITLGLLSRLNEWSTRKKLNNFLTDKTWDWDKEIVVVTGGSSGIGSCIVSKLVQKHVKVVIIDVNEPIDKLCKLF